VAMFKFRQGFCGFSSVPEAFLTWLPDIAAGLFVVGSRDLQDTKARVARETDKTSSLMRQRISTDRKL
jgi:hypothetical protein